MLFIYNVTNMFINLTKLRHLRVLLNAHHEDEGHLVMEMLFAKVDRKDGCTTCMQNMTLADTLLAN